MTRINLLPWREAKRVQQQRSFIATVLGAAIVAAVGVVGAHLYVNNLIDNQEARNQFLRAEIARLKRFEQEIQEMERSEARLRQRLATIQTLQRSRPEMVRMFDELVRKLPEDLYLAQMQTAGNQLRLYGTAEINNVVSDFMRELDQSPLFGEPTLRVINNREIAQDVVASQFELNVVRTPLVKKSGQEDEELIGAVQ